MKQITLLGSTGSIGQQTLEIIRLHPEQYQVYALTAKSNHERLLTQCLEFNPKFAVLICDESALKLASALKEKGSKTEVLSGEAALSAVASASEVEFVMAAIVGAAGLLPNLAAAQAGKTLLLANKEALVMSGRLFMQAVKDHGATLLPVDSEHNAVSQCWQGKKSQIQQIYLTASGGPFLGLSPSQLQQITPAQAVAHPNWSMGRKISVDSATLMNKGLEVIEASYLFDLPTSQIGVIIHPQSIAHAFVEYIDGSVLTHMGHHDMRVAISYALGYPDRIISGAPRLGLLSQAAELDFRPLAPGEFPCFDLCLQAHQAGEAAVIALNAANELAVQAFLDQSCAYLDIPGIIEDTLADHLSIPIESVEDVLRVDKHARQKWMTNAKFHYQSRRVSVSD